MPYEQMLIPHLEEIKLEFKEAIEDHIGHFSFDDLIFVSTRKKPIAAIAAADTPSQNPE